MPEKYGQYQTPVKKLVHFKNFNLKERIASAKLFDMVLCRNVMVILLTRSTKRTPWKTI